jgi:uncharacterized protein YggL (DUF469 family)
VIFNVLCNFTSRDDVYKKVLYQFQELSRAVCLQNIKKLEEEKTKLHREKEVNDEELKDKLLEVKQYKMVNMSIMPNCFYKNIK